MPPFREVRGYIGGLWLLFQADKRGLAPFDPGRRSVLRSFWAFAYTLPAMALNWAIDWFFLIPILGQDAQPVETFVAKSLLHEVIGWSLPLIMLMVGTFAFGLQHVQATLVIVWNWLAMITVYAAVAITLPLFWLPWPEDETITIAVLAILYPLIAAVGIASLVATWNVLKIIVGRRARTRLGLILMATLGGGLAIVTSTLLEVALS